MENKIRKATLGDEKVLAYIQTESWKAAFADILPPDDLERSTNIETSYRTADARLAMDKKPQFT